MVLFVIASGTAILTFYIVPLHWRGQYREKENAAISVLPYSDEFKSGLRRLIPMIAITSWCGLLISFGIFLDQTLGVDSDLVGQFFFVPAICVMFVVAIVSYAIIYRSAPKFLIAPPYRSELGVVETRRVNGTLWRSRIRNLFIALVVLAIFTCIYLLVR